MIDEELWEAYLEMRLTHGKKINTDYALKLIRKKLAAWEDEGYSANEALENSIMSGWRGVFKPREKKQHATTIEQRLTDTSWSRTTH